jgi:hypothetical protein
VATANTSSPANDIARLAEQQHRLHFGFYRSEAGGKLQSADNGDLWTKGITITGFDGNVVTSDPVGHVSAAATGEDSRWTMTLLPGGITAATWFPSPEHLDAGDGFRKLSLPERLVAE